MLSVVTLLASLVDISSSISLPPDSAISVAPCGDFEAYQQFEIDSSNPKYSILSLKYFANSCLDCNGCYMYINALIQPCNSSTTNPNQMFTLLNISSSNAFLLNSNKMGANCLQVYDGNDDIGPDGKIPLAYNTLSMQPCDQSYKTQQFNYDPATKYISIVANSSLCLTAMKPNCTVKPFNTYPYCNQQLPSTKRAEDLVSRMTLYEKILGLNYYNPLLGLPENIFAEALHGILCDCGETFNGNTGCPTSFPHALLMGASFNRSLWKEVAIAISDEGRAFANQGITGLYYWAPDINLFRDPRWGRGQEVPGEDPFLTSQYVMEYSTNMKNGEDTRYIKVVSTAKHYADYDQEGNFGINRLAFDANVSDQDQVEYYWPAFRAAVQVGKVDSIMCSYPSINGVPACGNDFFMNQIARKEWGFDGFFISDEGALSDQAFINYIDELYPNSTSQEKNMQMCRIGIEAGCDVDLGGFWLLWMQNAVEADLLDESVIDTASHRFWRRVIETGEIDYPPSYYTTYGPDRIDSPKHREIAQRAAEQGIVLLKNNGNILPLNIKDGVTRVAMIGPHANVTQDMLSSYRGANTLVNSQSPYQAMKRAYPSVSYSLGCDYLCNDTNGFKDAINVATAADYTLIFLGIHPPGGQALNGCDEAGAACEAEGIDRNTVILPGNQLELLQSVYNATRNSNTKVILVLINGGAIDISWAKENIDAIVEGFYPGELGGPALVNVLSGKTPIAGKLPYTIYNVSLMYARPTIMDMSLRDNGGLTYRYYTGTPVYPFGYGLYYTNFTYKYYGDQIRVVNTKNLADAFRNGHYFYKSEATSFTVQVTNIGNVASDCIVLGFVTSNGDPDAPLNKLFDFQRVFVKVGQSVNVSLSVSPEAISITNKDGNERIVPGTYDLHLGDYMNNNYITTQLVMEGAEESIFNLPEIREKYERSKKKHNV